MSYSKFSSTIVKGTKKLSKKHDELLNKLINVLQDDKNRENLKNDHPDKYDILSNVLKRKDFKEKLFAIMTSYFNIVYNSRNGFSFNPHDIKSGLFLRLVKAIVVLDDSNRLAPGTMSKYKHALNDALKGDENFKNFKSDFNELFILHESHTSKKCLSKKEVNLLTYGYWRKNSKNMHDDVVNVTRCLVGSCESNLMWNGI